MADIGKITKLPEATKPPLQRWQQLPLRPKSRDNSPARMKTPKMVRSVRTTSKTPKSTGKPKTPVHNVTMCKTTKTPKSTGKPPKTPSGCRFLPSRGPNDEYSSYLLLKGETVATGEQEKENDSENEEDKTDPEYRSALMSVACCGEVPRGVLTFRNTTPANTHQGQFKVRSTNARKNQTRH